jgi:3-methyladenine DNA glycosylase AlkD
LSAESIIKEMRSKADPKAVAGMARFRISSENTLGLSVPTLRRMAEKLGRDHRLALGLWKSGIHEARILASMVDEPEKVTERQMDEWARDFDSWDVCDQCCGNLFDKTPYSFAKALEWSGIREEFVKRAGFSMMAELAAHDKKAGDGEFLKFFDAIARGRTTTGTS